MTKSVQIITGSKLNNRTIRQWSKYFITLARLYGYFHLTLRCCHNDHDGVSNHQPHECLLNLLFRRRSKRTSKLCVTGLCAGNSPVTFEFPAQIASNAENVSIWWRHRDSKSGWLNHAVCSPCRCQEIVWCQFGNQHHPGIMPENRKKGLLHVTLRREGCMGDCPGRYWRRWRQASTSPVTTRATTLATSPCLYSIIMGYSRMFSFEENLQYIPWNEYTAHAALPWALF